MAQSPSATRILRDLSVREVTGDGRAQCAQTRSAACVHGTLVAGILSAKARFGWRPPSARTARSL